jgi:hypothetical protein
MRKTSGLAGTGLFVAATIILPAARAGAQQVVGTVSGGASFVHGIGYRNHAFHFGGGVEVGSGPVRLGGEIGLVNLPAVSTTFHDPVTGASGGGTMPEATVGAYSFRSSYYPVRFAQNRLQPFVTGGMTVYPDGEGTFATFDFGGGFDWWATRHLGLRVDVREQYGSFFAARAGIVVR